LGVALIILLARQQGASVLGAPQNISWPTLFIAVAWYLLSQVISASKWKLLLGAALRQMRAEGSTPFAAPGLGECYRFYLIGMFCNLWLPTAVGGDAIRATLAGNRWNNFALAASSILVERLTGLLALLLIGAIGWFLWWPQQAALQTGGAPVLSLAAAAAFVAGVLCTLLWTLRRWALHLETSSHSQWIAKWAQLHRALDTFTAPQMRPALWQALALSVVFHGAQIGLQLFLARAVGLNLAPITFLWLVPSLAIASMIPLGLGGLGVREGAALVLLQSAASPHFSAEPSVILTWSLLWQVTLWLSGLPGALAYAFQNRTPK